MGILSKARSYLVNPFDFTFDIECMAHRRPVIPGPTIIKHYLVTYGMRCCKKQEILVINYYADNGSWFATDKGYRDPSAWRPLRDGLNGRAVHGIDMKPTVKLVKRHLDRELKLIMASHGIQ